MSKEKKEFYQKIKFYDIVILSIILSPLLILNSKYTEGKRTQEKLNKDSEKKFNKIIYPRNLESFEDGMNEICNKGSEELKNYYINGIIDEIDAKINSDKDNNKENPEYINALIDIIKSSKGEDAEGDLSGNALIYGKHILGIVIFLAIAILSIPGWMICCSCCCCNCCCCCCCKSPKCKIPFYVITMLLYLLVIGICIYGLVKSNSIFRGLADTECSVLQFCNEVIEGENKEEKPKWIGISGIVNLLDSVENKINSLGKDKLTQLQTQNATIRREKEEFEDLLKSNSEKVTDENNNYELLNSYKYRLDITSKDIYGVFDKEKREGKPETSFVNLWYKEYSATAENSEKYIGEATENFNKVLDENEGNDVIKGIDSIKSNVQDIGNSINDIKNGIADSIIDYSSHIDKYGKLVFKILYAILIIIVGSIAIFMILLGFCSGKLCNCCCCFRFAFKVFIHILWNILALLMIITFFFGFILSFVGTIGSDMVYVINFFISEENLSKEEPTLFGNEGKKLNKCFNGEGDILNDLGLNLDDIGSFDELNEINKQIEIIENNFTDLKKRQGTYSIMIDELNKRKDNSKNDFTIISYDTSASPSSYKFSEVEDSDIINTITKLVKIANNELSEHQYNYKKKTNELKAKYDIFLDAELGTLRIFNETIRDITGIFDDYIGEGGKVFDFVNCLFIGKNIHIILKNLRDNLGGDFYTVGVCLLVAGCSMALAICFTILLVIIVNESVDKNKEK